jgi:hypothetical protein
VDELSTVSSSHQAGAILVWTKKKAKKEDKISTIRKNSNLKS